MKKEYQRQPDERLYSWCFRLANDVLWNRLETDGIYEILKEVSQASYFAGVNAEDELRRKYERH